MVKKKTVASSANCELNKLKKKIGLTENFSPPVFRKG